MLALALFPLVGGSFMPESDSEQLAVVVKTPVGSSLDYSRDRVREVSALLHRYPEVEYTYEERRLRGSDGREIGRAAARGMIGAMHGDTRYTYLFQPFPHVLIY